MAAIIVILTGCVSAPPTQGGTAPEWVASTPPTSPEYTYFVGRGSDGRGNLSAANERAFRSLVDEVVRSLGTAVDSQKAAETRPALRSFRATLLEKIRKPSPAAGEDFDVIDRWISHDGDRVAVYLLGRYRSAALSAVREQLQAPQQTRAATLSEGEGDALMNEGKPFAAARRYVQAVAEASGPQVDNAREKLDRSMRKAREAVAAIKLTAVSDNLEGSVGKPLPKPFEVDVTTRFRGATAPLADVPFRVAYPVQGGNDRLGTDSMKRTSDTNGRVVVALPPPELLGAHTVTLTLDMSGELDALRSVPSLDPSLLASLEKQIEAVRLVLHYTTTSEAASIPTGVLVIDLDRGGTPIAHDDTAEGIVGALTRAGFTILSIPSNRSILGIDSPDLVKIVRNNFGTKIKRVIIGQAQISGFDQADGTYIVKVSGRAEVADLATGKVLFSTNQVKLSRASDASSAITAAFKDLGTSIGDTIKNSLH